MDDPAGDFRPLVCEEVAEFSDRWVLFFFFLRRLSVGSGLGVRGLMALDLFFRTLLVCSWLRSSSVEIRHKEV